MIIQMFKTSLQSMIRNPFLSIMPFIGIVVGLTTALLTFIWISYEFTYNRYHTENSNVFAILLNEQGDGEIITGDEVPLPYNFLIEDVPEIQSATRIDNTYIKLSVSENLQIEKTGVFADSTFFDVHATEFIGSLSENPLQDLNAIAISENTASLLFKTNDVIGKSILVNENKEFIISALFKNYPANSDLKHIHFVIPFNAKPRDEEDIWHNIRVKLYPEANLQKTEALFNTKLKELLGEDAPVSTLLFNMDDWRLFWNFENGKQTGGKITYVIVFMISGILILIMSCINYMNISIAKATKKAKEIGIRKISGATQKQIAVHFMFQNILLIVLATLFSLFLAYAIIPQVRELTNAPISINFNDPLLWLGLISIVSVASLLAGAYPAFILSSLKPVVVLKNNLFTISGGAKLRKYLLTFQLALSVFLVFGSFTVWKQIDYLLKGISKNPF
jgi:putative ABC transport system permease protein